MIENKNPLNIDTIYDLTIVYSDNSCSELKISGQEILDVLLDLNSGSKYFVWGNHAIFLNQINYIYWTDWSPLSESE
jgi:hypothetical protein